MNSSAEFDNFKVNFAKNIPIGSKGDLITSDFKVIEKNNWLGRWFNRSSLDKDKVANKIHDLVQKNIQKLTNVEKEKIKKNIISLQGRFKGTNAEKTLQQALNILSPQPEEVYKPKANVAQALSQTQTPSSKAQPQKKSPKTQPKTQSTQDSQAPSQSRITTQSQPSQTQSKKNATSTQASKAKHRAEPTKAEEDLVKAISDEINSPGENKTIKTLTERIKTFIERHQDKTRYRVSVNSTTITVEDLRDPFGKATSIQAKYFMEEIKEEDFYKFNVGAHLQGAQQRLKKTKQ